MIISIEEGAGGEGVSRGVAEIAEKKEKKSMKIAIVFQATGEDLGISLVRLDGNKNLPQVTNDPALKAALDVFTGIVKRHQKTAGGAK